MFICAHYLEYLRIYMRLEHLLIRNFVDYNVKYHVRNENLCLDCLTKRLRFRKVQNIPQFLTVSSKLWERRMAEKLLLKK